VIGFKLLPRRPAINITMQEGPTARKQQRKKWT
jgi:hypothetical protein